MNRLNHHTTFSVLFILSYTAFVNPEIAAKVPPEDVTRLLRPPVGSNLTQMTLGAADGSTIILGPGEYKGPVVVQNKSLIVKGDPGGETLLSGELEQALVVVQEGGRLILENISLQGTGKTEVGLYINDGTAQVTRCKAEGLDIKLFYVQNGSLSIDQCSFKQINAIPVSAMNQSEIKVTNSTFEDISECVVGINQARNVEVKNNIFKKTGGAVVLQKGQPTVKVTDNVISDTDAKEHAIWIEAGDEVIISNNKIFKVGSGILLRTKLINNVTVSDNTIVDCGQGAVYVEGIGPEDTTNVNIKNNHIVNSGE